MFGHRLRLFRLLGFAIHIDATWLVLAALIVWSLAAGYFPLVAPDRAGGVYWLMAVSGLLGLAASVVAHELAHAVVARHLDLRIAGITLFLFGGVAEMAEEPDSPRAELLMALAGPALSLAVGAAAWGALAVGLAAGMGAVAAALLGYLAMVNLLLAGFNLIPAFPLDGGRVLRALLWAWRGDLLWATWVATGGGRLLGMVLMVWGMWTALMLANPFGGLWWVVIGLFVHAAAVESYRRQAVRSRVAGPGM
ncbi:MAG: site-2 protease family protein [Magnetospirillum sp.]|nr:site-2 protease family protein [Magnetospirillum sp.]